MVFRTAKDARPPQLLFRLGMVIAASATAPLIAAPRAGSTPSAVRQTGDGGDPQLKSPKDLVPLLRSTLPPAPPEGGEVVVVRLEGGFDEDYGFGIGSTITPGSFDALMTVANERKPAAIVLNINSEGGRLDVLRYILEQTNRLQRTEQRRVVAWPKDAGSAAAILSLACKEIVVTPVTRMGAATVIFHDGEAVPEPKNAGEQKFAAWQESLDRMIRETTGRPPAIQQAMQDPALELWWHPKDGFRTARPASPEGWIGLDTDTTKPCVLTADQLMETGIAQGRANSPDDVLKTLGLPPKTAVRQLNLDHPNVQAAVRELESHLKRIFEEAEKVQADTMKRLSTAIVKAKTAITFYDTIPRSVTPKHITELINATVTAKNGVPRISPRSRESLTALMAEDELSHLEFHLEEARGMLTVVTKSLEQLRRQKAGSIDAIRDRLVEAHNHLTSAYNGPEPPKQ